MRPSPSQGPLDLAAFTALYRQYVVMVQARARRILRDPDAAQDVTQEVFIKLVQYLRRHPEVRYMGALLFQMTTQAAVRKLHSQKMTTSSEIELSAPSEHADEHVWFAQVLACVSEEQAQVAFYYFQDGMTMDEIASVLAMSRRNVGRLLERFCDKARRLSGDKREVTYEETLERLSRGVG